jgi:hypothetical protein
MSNFFPDIITKSPETKFVEREPTSEGIHDARIVGIIDMGLHTNPKFGKTAHKLNLDIVILDETVNNKESKFHGKMKHVYKNFNNSDSDMGDLHKTLMVPLGLKKDEKGHYNVVQLLMNLPIQVNIIHKHDVDKKGKAVVYDNIAGFSPVKKGTVLPDSDVEPYVYSLTNHSEESLSKVPLYIQKRINFASFGVNYSIPDSDTKVNADFGKS